MQWLKQAVEARFSTALSNDCISGVGWRRFAASAAPASVQVAGWRARVMGFYFMRGRADWL